MYDQQNVMATARDNISQNTDKAQTPNPRIEIKMPDLIGNRTWSTELDGRGFTDRAIATNLSVGPNIPKIIQDRFCETCFLKIHFC